MRKASRWTFAGGGLDLDPLKGPAILGILNATPDSFSDGGRHQDPARALDAALRMIEDGAAVLDVGGESTRPGAAPVSLDDELRRVLPVIEAIRGVTNHPISVDTTKAEVARLALAAGANIVNDVSAFRFEPAGLAHAVAAGAGVVLMHTPARPAEMMAHAGYDDVVADVAAHLVARALHVEAAGVARSAIVLDPGFGFGKGRADNYSLLRKLGFLAAKGYPVLAGVSRKRMIREATGDNPTLVEHGTTAAHMAAMMNGAALLRTHDTAAAVAARAVFRELAAGGLDG